MNPGGFRGDSFFWSWGARSYVRNGYEWDVGVHYIGDVGSRKSPTRKLYDFITDSQLQWAPMDDNYDRFFFGAERFDVMAGRKPYVAALKARFPDEAEAIDAYRVRLAMVGKAVNALSVEKLLPSAAARLFISNAGVYNTFEHLLPEKVSRRHVYAKRLQTVAPSIGHPGRYIIRIPPPSRLWHRPTSTCSNGGRISLG